jgi:transposase InsO family protein
MPGPTGRSTNRDDSRTTSGRGHPMPVHPPAVPWQNGKEERFNRTPRVEWAYRQPFTSNIERAAALDPWLELDNI